MFKHLRGDVMLDGDMFLLTEDLIVDFTNREDRIRFLDHIEKENEELREIFYCVDCELKYKRG